MFAHDFKWLAIGVPGALFIALSLLSISSHSQNGGNTPPSSNPSAVSIDAKPPPVEQALVPEGVFAMQIAEALKQGPATDAAKAEELLSSLGIEPQNGWITEYPVTPAVLGEVDKGIMDACDRGAIALTKAEALKRINDVKIKLGIHVDTDGNASSSQISSPPNPTIYSYTDNKGAKHYTDNYDSIPTEYQKNAEIISQLTPEAISERASRRIPTVTGPQSMTNPSPDIINNYYIDQGPPAVTYYSPPESYSYLYSWVPYSFWSSGFFFPGFFVLNNFHRRVFVHRHPFFISHHAGPIKGGFSTHSASAGSGFRSGFFSPNAQTGARSIIELNQNHHRFKHAPRDSFSNTFSRPFSSSEHGRNFDNRNRRSLIDNGHIQRNFDTGGREFIPRNEREFITPNQREFIPRHEREFITPNQREFIPKNERSFIPNQPGQRSFSERHNFDSRRSDGGLSGRFRHDTDRGRIRGEQNIERGRAIGGGSRDGRR